MLKTGSFNSVAGNPGWVASTFERAKMVTFGEDGEAWFEEIDGGFLCLLSRVEATGSPDEFSDPLTSHALFVPGLTSRDIQALCRGEQVTKSGKNEFELALRLVLQKRRPGGQNLCAAIERAERDSDIGLFLYKGDV